MRSYFNNLMDMVDSGSSAPTLLLLKAGFGDPQSLKDEWFKNPEAYHVEIAGVRPLHVAAIMDNLGTAETLVTDLRQDINVEDSRGFTPFFYACQYSSEKTLMFLASHGANLNHQALNGSTALHHAKLSGRHRVLTTLLYMGADPEIEDHEGSTVIQTHARAGDIVTSCTLARMGADAFKKDRHGKSAMRMAKDMGWGEHLDRAVQDWRITSGSYKINN